MTELSAPQHPIKASLKISGSKSISNRWLILKELLQLNVELLNLSDSEDSGLLQKALQLIKQNSRAEIDVQHAGTDMRFLTALLACRTGDWLLTGSARMKQRPIHPLVDALRTLGAGIDYLEAEQYPPLRIHGKQLAGGALKIDSSLSSQFVSALLLVAPAFAQGLELSLKGKTVSRSYIDLTLSVLREAGIQVEASETNITVPPQDLSTLPQHTSITVESDWSSASYWFSICALSGNASIELSSFQEKSSQADAVLPELFKALGVRSSFRGTSLFLESIPPIATEFNYDFTLCPDIAQTLALTCFGLGIKARLNGLSTLKLKESDRILALKTELEKAGALVTAGADYLYIEPNLKPGTRNKKLAIKTYTDHRMAMCFAPLALRYKSLLVEDAAVVGKSYPAFWEDLKSVGFNVNLQA